MNISADTFCFLAVAALFVLFILPRLIGSMSGGYPQGNYPQGTPTNNGPLNGNDRPTYDSTDVESRGSIGRERGRTSGGIFGNILSRPSSRPSSSGGTGIFRTPSSGGNLSSSSSSRHDSPNVESRGSIGRDRD